MPAESEAPEVWVAQRRDEISRNVAARLAHDAPLDEDYAFMIGMTDDEVLTFAGQARRALVAFESDAEFEAFLDDHWHTFTPPEAPEPATAEPVLEPVHTSVISLEELLRPGGAMASRRFATRP